MMSVSVVVPLKDEQENIEQLYAQLVGAADGAQDAWEFIFVDDGSTDGTWEVLKHLTERDSRMRLIRLKRNFGQTAAMACGIEAARGEVIVTMDGDLQNDPADIPRLLEKLSEGYDVVCGWRHKRQDKLLTRKIPSMVANRLIGWLTGVRLHDYGCSLKAYRAASIKRTPLYAELHRFIPAMSTLTGALVAELKVNHRPRRFGQTKYNLSRTWRVALDMITVSLLVKFSTKPLRLFGLIALGTLGVSLALTLRVLTAHVLTSGPLFQVLPGVVLLGFWLTGHLFFVGWMAELCLATSHSRPGQMIAVNQGASASS